MIARVHRDVGAYVGNSEGRVVGDIGELLEINVFFILTAATEIARIDQLQAWIDHQRSRAIVGGEDRKSTRLNSSHGYISYAVFCLKKKKKKNSARTTKKKKQTTYKNHNT